MDECGGVRITFPPSESGKDKIKLHGPKEDVEKAKSMLLELADEQVGVMLLHVYANCAICIFILFYILGSSFSRSILVRQA